MSLKTFKNSGIITKIVVKYKNIVFEFDDQKSLSMVAFGECCSRSFFQEKPGYKFSSLVGQKILSLHFDGRFHTERDDDCLMTSKSYKFKLENGKDFKFFLINRSNGFYTGWIEIDGVEQPYFESDTDIPSEFKSSLDPNAKEFVPMKKVGLDPNAKEFVPMKKVGLDPNAKEFVPVSKVGLDPNAKEFVPMKKVGLDPNAKEFVPMK